MKTMTCKQLGGACDKSFTAQNFDEMAELSKAHGMEMFQQGDAAHLEVIGEMQKLMMSSPDAMQNFLKEKEELFNSLPSN